METFAPEDILIDNLSFKLNKGSSYIVDRRSVFFFLQRLTYISLPRGQGFLSSV